MKQLTIISGKGGTGKTSLVASFAALANSVVTADCDVDAADLHLVLTPKIKSENKFAGGYKAQIDLEECIQCELCRDFCRFDAISAEFKVDSFSCEGCGVCSDICPINCIQLSQEVAGDWYTSETRFGPMVHARLGIAQETSGKLVALVRDQAKKIAQSKGIDLILIDGSPGIGCPVISSITGVDLVLVVTEPTLSGLHDLERVLKLTNHFNVPAAVCINKDDLNPKMAAKIEKSVEEWGASFVGRIPFDHDVTRAMVAKKTLPEFTNSAATSAVEQVWKNLSALLAI